MGGICLIQLGFFKFTLTRQTIHEFESLVEHKSTNNLCSFWLSDTNVNYFLDAKFFCFLFKKSDRTLFFNSNVKSACLCLIMQEIPMEAWGTVIVSHGIKKWCCIVVINFEWVALNGKNIFILVFHTIRISLLLVISQYLSYFTFTYNIWKFRLKSWFFSPTCILACVQ